MKNLPSKNDKYQARSIFREQFFFPHRTTRWSIKGRFDRIRRRKFFFIIITNRHEIGWRPINSVPILETNVPTIWIIIKKKSTRDETKRAMNKDNDDGKKKSAKNERKNK